MHGVDVDTSRALKLNMKSAVTSAAMIAAGLCGCVTNSVQSTRALSPDVLVFQKQLHLQYSELALRKLAEGNPPAAKVYNDKALRSADGLTVVPDSAIDHLTGEAYERLMHALERIGDNASAPDIARAQVMYDCWVDELRNNTDQGDMVACQRAFRVALRVAYGPQKSQERIIN